MNLFLKKLYEEISLTDKEELFLAAEEKYGHDSSWAIWGSEAKDPNAVETIMDRVGEINPNYIVVGMNQSEPVGTCGIFHKEKCSDTLKKFFDGTLNKYYGAFLTDLLNITDENSFLMEYEPDSQKLKDYLSTSEGQKLLTRSVSLFKEKFNFIKKYSDGEPKIIALGDLVNDIIVYKVGKPVEYHSVHPAATSSMKSLESKNRRTNQEDTKEDWEIAEYENKRRRALYNLRSEVKEKIKNQINEYIKKMRVQINIKKTSNNTEERKKEQVDELESKITKANKDLAYISKTNKSELNKKNLEKEREEEIIKEVVGIVDYYNEKVPVEKGGKINPSTIKESKSLEDLLTSSID